MAAVEEIPAATTGEEVVNVEGEVAETTEEVPAETAVSEVPPESTDAQIPAETVESAPVEPTD